MFEHHTRMLPCPSEQGTTGGCERALLLVEMLHELLQSSVHIVRLRPVDEKVFEALRRAPLCKGLHAASVVLLSTFAADF